MKENEDFSDGDMANLITVVVSSLHSGLATGLSYQITDIKH